MKRLLLLASALVIVASFAQAQTYPWVRNYTSDPTTAPVQFKAVCENASGFATVCTTSPSRYLGVCVNACAVSQEAQIAFAGLVPIIVDGTTTIGHYMIASSSVGGDGSDTAAVTYPTSGIVMGKVKVASTGAASVSIVDISPEIVGVTSGSAGGFAGVNAQTGNYTAVTGDSNKLITMNGSSITLTLPAAVPSATWNIAVLNLHSTALTIARNSLTINGGTSNVTLQQYQYAWVSPDGAGTNYNANVPLVAGSNITLTPAANGITVAATGGAPTAGTGISVSGTAVSLKPTGGDRAWLREYFCYNQNNSGYLGTHGWSFAGTINHGASVLNHPCGVQFIEANTVGAFAYAYLGSGPEKIIPPLSTLTSGEFIFGFQTPSNITNKNIRVGLRSSNIGADTESSTFIAELRYANSASGCTVTATDATWRYLLSDGTTDNSAGPAIAASTNYWLRIKVTSTGHLSFNLVADGVAWSSGTEVEVNSSTHIPTSAMTPFFQIMNCDGANAQNVGLNFFAMDLPQAGPQ